MEEVVVTATRTEVPLEELGVSATVITEEEIKRRQATDVLDLLREVAGIHVMRTGARGGMTSLFFRGGENNYTLVLIDGVQVNEAGGFYDFSTLTTDNIERIEIIRGPQSALYGSDAIGGVIHIMTKRGAGRPTLKLLTSNGARSENGHYIGEHGFSLWGGEPWIGYSLSYSRIDDQGILDKNNHFLNNTFSGRVDLYPSEKMEMTFTVRANDTHFEFPTEFGGDRVDRVFPGLDPDQYQKKKDITAGVSMVYTPFSWWENVVHLGLHWVDQRFNDPPDAESLMDASPGSSSDSLETRGTFDYHINIMPPEIEGLVKSIVTVGYEFERETLDLDSIYTLRFGPLPFGVFVSTESIDVDRTNHASYLQAQISLWERLHLTAGFRVEVNSEFGTDVNPRASVAYEIKETGTKIRGSIGTGIKEPTFFENFGGFGTVGNPDLDPERTFSWELGVDQRLFGGALTMGFTYFQNQYEDMIAFIPTPFPPPAVLPPNYQNIQEAESWGVEFMARYRPGFGLTIGASYTFVDTKVTDSGGLTNLFFQEGKELLRRPNHSGSLFVDWLWRGLNIHLTATYVGERDDNLYRLTPGPFGFYQFLSQRIENDDHMVLDLAASYTLNLPDSSPLKSVRLFARGNNILDEDYEEIAGYSSPGFSAMGGVEFTF
jgi:vitamin B12 transporter